MLETVCNIMLVGGVGLLIAGMILLVIAMVISFSGKSRKKAGSLWIWLMLAGFVLLILSGILYGWLGN